MYPKKEAYSGGPGGYQHVRYSNLVSLGSFTLENIKETLSKLNPKRGVAPDGIPPYIYKACREILAAPLLHMSNLHGEKWHEKI